MEVVSKDIVVQWILPHLSVGKRGPKAGVDLCLVVELILYRLKTGCQWRSLPIGAFMERGSFTWEGVYYHHRRWVRDGSWRRVWVELLKAHKQHLDLSTMQLDGSHTPAKKQGEGRGYQGRKAQTTTNALFLCDNCGQPLSLPTPQAGNHADVFEITQRLQELCAPLEEAGIDLRGVFVNADEGFDAQVLRQDLGERDLEANIPHPDRKTKPQNKTADYVYFDEELYKRRFLIERANAWLDGFKGLLIRYETKIQTWISMHMIAFAAILLRRVYKC
jgi:transposase